MRILGIDPGTGICGFGIIEPVKSNYKMIDAGVIRTKAHTPIDDRLEIIYDHIVEIIKEFKPDVMAIEKLFFARNVTTAMTVSQARGVIMLAAKQNKMPIFEYTPLQIKSSITGYGQADKKQIQEMVRVLLKLKEVPKPDDCADALAAAISHAMIHH